MIFLLFCFKANAQQQYETGQTRIGLNFSPNRSFRSLNNSENNPYNDSIYNSKSNETQKTGYSFGFAVSRMMSNRISFETGLQFSNQGYQKIYIGLVFGNMLNPSSGSPSKTATFYNRYKFQYLGIPVKLNFLYGEDKTRLFVSAGINLNILLKSNIRGTIHYPNSKNEVIKSSTNTTYNKFNLGPYLSFGVMSQINSKLNFKIGPYFNYDILSIRNSSLIENLWDIGFNIGLYRLF